eukprot:TRINITY_DN74801_c0_g1_i1.p1 TRINITY_DN74801_c0_g1~~TRINITY_DN74801_c0_g1_i1.p1  ORF type:complete len:439 (-),score=57.60 TRINITY_DN74801_c0_g1_i1:103-1335(-)
MASGNDDYEDWGLGRLGVVAERGDAEVIAALVSMLASQRTSIRRKVVEILGKLASKRDGAVTAALCLKLTHAEFLVRSIASKELGNQLALPTFKLEDPSSEVRLEVLKNLPLIAAKGNAAVVAAILTQLNDTDISVRSSAVLAVGRLASRNDRAAIDAVLGRLEDADEMVRMFAVNALKQIGRRCDATVIAKLRSKLASDDAHSVRAAAATALGQLAAVGNRQVIQDLRARLMKGFPAERASAAQALGLVATRGDATVVDELSALLAASSDDMVRLRSVEALGKIGMKGDAKVVAGISQVLTDSDPHVKERVLSQDAHLYENVVSFLLTALGQLATGCDTAVMSVLFGKLVHEDESLRRAALASLTLMAQGCSAASMKSVAQKLVHSGFLASEVAQQVMQELTKDHEKTQ